MSNCRLGASKPVGHLVPHLPSADQRIAVQRSEVQLIAMQTSQQRTAKLHEQLTAHVI